MLQPSVYFAPNTDKLVSTENNPTGLSV